MWLSAYKIWQAQPTTHVNQYMWGKHHLNSKIVYPFWDWKLSFVLEKRSVAWGWLFESRSVPHSWSCSDVDSRISGMTTSYMVHIQDGNAFLWDINGMTEWLSSASSSTQQIQEFQDRHMLRFVAWVASLTLPICLPKGCSLGWTPDSIQHVNLEALGPRQFEYGSFGLWGWIWGCFET